MIVLEEWVHKFKHRLVVTEDGGVRSEFRYGKDWMGCNMEAHLPLFAPTKTPQRPASTSPRRRRSPRG